MCGRSYRPRPANGSGDSPRPPFLSEFVNHIGKLSLVEVVYHLFGGTLATRVHPHVERSIRLKAKSARRIVQLQAADSDVGQNSIDGRCLYTLRNLCERSMQQRDLWPVGCRLSASGFRIYLSPKAGSRKPEARNLQRCRIFIEANQMSRCAEAFCDFVTVSAQAHRGVDIGPTPPHGSQV